MKLKLVSLKTIADKLKQNPLMHDMNWEFIVSRAVECLGVIGTPAMYVDKTTDLNIKQFRALLPPDMLGITGVSKVHNNGLIPMRTSEDILSQDYAGFGNLPGIDDTTRTDYTYSTSHSAIFTDFEEGNVILSYQTIPTDEDCFPLIPGSPELLRAVEAYLRYKWYDILNDLDQVSDRKLAKVESTYYWYVGQAQNVAVIPNLDEMETLVNSITQILPSRTQHRDRFQFLGQQEYMKIH